MVLWASLREGETTLPQTQHLTLIWCSTLVNTRGHSALHAVRMCFKISRPRGPWFLNPSMHGRAYNSRPRKAIDRSPISVIPFWLTYLYHSLHHKQHTVRLPCHDISLVSDSARGKLVMSALSVFLSSSDFSLSACTGSVIHVYAVLTCTFDMRSDACLCRAEALQVMLGNNLPSGRQSQTGIAAL